MPTPHISAADGAFAPTVLMPGDPLRAARIADRFLDDAGQLVNRCAAARTAANASTFTIVGRGTLPRGNEWAPDAEVGRPIFPLSDLHPVA